MLKPVIYPLKQKNLSTFKLVGLPPPPPPPPHSPHQPTGYSFMFGVNLFAVWRSGRRSCMTASWSRCVRSLSTSAWVTSAWAFLPFCRSVLLSQLIAAQPAQCCSASSVLLSQLSAAQPAQCYSVLLSQLSAAQPAQCCSASSVLLSQHSATQPAQCCSASSVLLSQLSATQPAQCCSAQCCSISSADWIAASWGRFFFNFCFVLFSFLIC